jgi:hypothetical protein
MGQSILYSARQPTLVPSPASSVQGPAGGCHQHRTTYYWQLGIYSATSCITFWELVYPRCPVLALCCGGHGIMANGRHMLTCLEACPTKLHSRDPFLLCFLSNLSLIAVFAPPEITSRCPETSDVRRRIAAAGRSAQKLKSTMADFGGAAATAMPGIDVSKPESLLRMAQAARLVINCVGPYRLYGEPVVAACVEAGVDYMDVCGEPGASSGSCLVPSAVFVSINLPENPYARSW